MVINPIVGVYIPIIRIPIKGGMTIPNIATGFKSSPSSGEPGCPGAANEDMSIYAMEISPALYSHLLDYEILSGSSIYDRKGCLLVNDIQFFDSDRIWGKICESPFGNLRHLEQTRYQGYKQSGQEVLFEVEQTMMEKILVSTTVLLYDFELTAGRGEFPSKVLHLRPTKNSFLVPWEKEQSTIPWMVDLFAGGYGGWSYALRFLTEDLQQYSTLPPYQQHRVIAIEQDIPAAASHAHNHDMFLLPDENLPWDWFHQHPHSSVVNAPIQSPKWKQSVAVLPADLWTISHPCQSWTNAAHSKGFDDANGLAFATSLGLIRIFRPKYVGLENVKHFQDHCQFPIVQSLIQWAGYRVLHQGIHDASQQLPVKRPRYLAVLQRVEEDYETFQWHSWKTTPNVTPNMWDAWIPTSQEEFQQFTLAPEAKCMYLDPKLLPFGTASQFNADMMKFRIPPANQKLPVFMAAYGSHHHLPFSLLKEKGMHGFFTRENGTYRWYKPEELLLLHSHPYSCTLLKPAELSWKFLGNAIVIHHATLVLANILGNQQGLGSKDDFHLIFQTLNNRRLRATTSMTFSDEYAWYVGQREQIIHQQDKIRFLAQEMKWLGDSKPTWPEGVYFHSKHGLKKLIEDPPVVFDLTVPMTIEDSTDNEEDNTIEHNHCCTITIAASPGTYGILQIEDLWQWSDIFDLWGENFQPYTIEGDFCTAQNLPFKAILLPGSTDRSITKIDTQRHCILWNDEDGSHCLPIVHGIKWCDVQRDNPKLDEFSYDDFCKIPPEMVLQGSIKVSVEPLLIQPFPDIQDCVPSFGQVDMVALTPNNTDILVIVFVGPQEDLINVLSFWHYALNEQWLEHHSREICLQVESTTKARLIFRPDGCAFATPINILQSSIQAQLIKTVFESYHCQEADSRVQVQFEHRYICEVALPSDQTFEDFYQLCQHVTLFTNNGVTPALMVGMKRVGDSQTIGKLVDHYGQSFRCIVGRTLVGGANKQEHKQTIQAALASALIEKGIKLADVSTHVQNIIKQIGLPKLTQVLFVASEPERTEQVDLIIAECEIPLQGRSTKVTTAKAKFAKISLDQQMKQSRQLDVTQYKLMPGFFVRADGDPLPIQGTFSPCISGVTMMPTENAEQWLMHKGKIIPEEMAIFLIGDLTEEQQQKTQKVVAPAFNTSGDQVLLAGWLLQLGETPVQLATNDTPKVQTLDVQVCSITLWASDFTTDQWREITKSPVKQTKLILDKDQLGEVIKNPWGRTFRQGKNPCVQSEATSVQFHTEIMIKDLRKLLHRSGFNKVFVTPKDLGGAPSQEWRIIWTLEPPQTLETKTMSQPGAAGLIKGNKNYGLRVEPSAFAQIWQFLHPGEEPPKQIPKGTLWRLHPLPYGVDKQVMQEWADNVGWTCYPIKPLGAKAWLMQSKDSPPHKLLSFNGQPLIIKIMPSKAETLTTGLIAGPKSKPISDVASEKTNIFRTGDPHHDAWAAWQPTTYKAGKQTTIAAEETPGPTTAHLQQHDQQLQTLEQAIKNLEDAQKQKETKDTARFTDLEDSIAQNHQQMQGAFHALRSDFQASLSQAITQQDVKLSKGFDELKDLFRQRDKRRKPEKTEDMESSE